MALISCVECITSSEASETQTRISWSLQVRSSWECGVDLNKICPPNPISITDVKILPQQARTWRRQRDCDCYRIDSCSICLHLYKRIFEIPSKDLKQDILTACQLQTYLLLCHTSLQLNLIPMSIWISLCVSCLNCSLHQSSDSAVLPTALPSYRKRNLRIFFWIESWLFCEKVNL